MNSNAKWQIIITRPINTAQGLKQRLESQGFAVIVYPCLEIVANPEGIEHFQSDQSLFDLAIFISPSAAQYGLQFSDFKSERWQKTLFIAQGPGTVKVLNEAEITPVLSPEKDYTSEKLLSLAPLQHCRDQKIALFKGKAGRGLLTTVLKQRKARVSEFELYERHPPKVVFELTSLLNEALDSLFVVNTVSALSSLAESLQRSKPHGPSIWRHCHLLVINDKMIELAQSLGHRGRIHRAENASDEAITARIIEDLSL